MQILITVSLSLLVGLLLSRLAKVLQLPAVTAYLVAGILIGPFLLGAVEIPKIGFLGFSEMNIKSFSLISDVALGFIAFSIGNEFRISQLKKIGKQATVIGIFQAVLTTVLVDIFLVALHFMMPEVLPLPVAITLGAIASATAPAATLMVVKQYKAKGPLTDILLPVVALDDAVGLVLFAVSFGVARALSAGAVSIMAIILEPIIEILLSLLLGAIMGMLFSYVERFFHSNSKRLAVSLAFVFLTVAISMIDDLEIGGIHIAFSPLLSCMMLGTVFCNVCDFSEELMSRVDKWASPILVLFFVLSGAKLDLTVFERWQIVLIGVVYIVARSIGKYSGAFASAKMVKCDDNIVKYLGITLLPQAGVALGMAFKAEEKIDGEMGALIVSITLFAILIYELVGPMLTKISLTRAGDIKPEGRVSSRRPDGEHFRRPHDVHHTEH